MNISGKLGGVWQSELISLVRILYLNWEHCSISKKQFSKPLIFRPKWLALKKTSIFLRFTLLLLFMLSSRYIWSLSRQNLPFIWRPLFPSTPCWLSESTSSRGTCFTNPLPNWDCHGSFNSKRFRDLVFWLPSSFSLSHLIEESSATPRRSISWGLKDVWLFEGGGSVFLGDPSTWGFSSVVWDPPFVVSKFLNDYFNYKEIKKIKHIIILKYKSHASSSIFFNTSGWNLWSTDDVIERCFSIFSK